MSQSNPIPIKWLKEPEVHDYPAAANYLSLLYDDKTVKRLIKALKRAPVGEYKAKDLFRASQLSLLGVSNSHVEKDGDKIRAGKPISPLLLVRTGVKVVVADGYHRLCAGYATSEDLVIKAKIVDLQASPL
jgi:hypothetical protein